MLLPGSGLCRLLVLVPSSAWAEDARGPGETKYGKKFKINMEKIKRKHEKINKNRGKNKK